MSEPDPVIGMVVQDRFEIESKLGQGGMATVYRARDQASGEEVALKLLPREFLEQPEYVARFRREASAVATIQHPNVIRVMGQGMAGDQPWYAMEYLPHPDLEGVLEERGVLPREEVHAILLGLARALDVCHERELFHRDIKPANVVIAPGPRPVLMDFGLVRDTNRTQLTATGTVMGTPLYMSPELINGTIAEAPSDIYQVGLLAYEMLSGRRAHHADSVMEVATLCMTGEFDPIERYCPDLPGPWCDVVANMLANDPEVRYGTARELLKDLIAVGKGQTIERRGGDPEATAVLPGPGSGTGPYGKNLTPAPGSSPALGRSHPGGALGRSHPGSGLGHSAPSGAYNPHHSVLGSTLPPGEKPPLPAWLKPALLFVTLTFLAVVIDIAPDLTPRDIHIEPGLAGFRITWVTDGETPSVVQVRGGGETEWRSYLSEDEPAGGVTTHSLDVMGYAQGDQLEVRVVSDEELVSAVQDVTVRTLELRDLRVEARGRDALWVAFRPSVPAEYFLYLAGPGRDEELPFKEGDKAWVEAQISRLTPDLERLVLVAATESGDLVEVDMAARLGSYLEQQVQALEGLDSNEIAREILLDPETSEVVLAQLIRKRKGESDAERTARLAKAEAALMDYLQRRTPYGAIQALQGLSPWALGAPGLEPTLRARVYEALDAYFGVVWFAKDQGVTSLYEQLPGSWGPFHETLTSRLPPGTEAVPVDQGGANEFAQILAVREAPSAYRLRRARGRERGQVRRRPGAPRRCERAAGDHLLRDPHRPRDRGALLPRRPGLGVPCRREQAPGLGALHSGERHREEHPHQRNEVPRGGASAAAVRTAAAPRTQDQEEEEALAVGGSRAGASRRR